MLLAVMCEGECEIDEGQLTEVLASGVGLEEERADAKKESKAPYGSRTHDLRITSATLYH